MSLKEELKKRGKGPKRSVTVEEADNGYLVRMYEPSDGPMSPGGEKKFVCKGMDDVMEAIETMMGGKSEKKEKGEENEAPEEKESAPAKVENLKKKYRE